MTGVTKVDLEHFNLEITNDWQVSTREKKPGPPERLDGLTIGYVESDRSAPHGGEVHPNGDEMLLVIPGQLEVACDSAPGDPLIVKPGEACIVPKGEWHKVNVVGQSRFIHITPGPDGDHRPLKDK